MASAHKVFGMQARRAQHLYFRGRAKLCRVEPNLNPRYCTVPARIKVAWGLHMCSASPSYSGDVAMQPSRDCCGTKELRLEPDLRSLAPGRPSIEITVALGVRAL